MAEHAEAIQCFSETLSIKPNEIDCLEKRGELLARLGRFREAEVDFGAVIAIDPNNVPALCNLSACAANAGDPEKALSYLKKARSLAPRDEVVGQNYEACSRMLDR